MLKNDVTWPNTMRYKSRTEWEPLGFFSEALCNSTSFDLMLGFFSSSAINVLSDSFATFLYNGGEMRMVINDILSQEDRDAIIVGEDSFDIPVFNIREIESFSNTLSKRDRHFFECLAWLIRNERIEIKIIAPKEGTGIAHSKCGVFSDGYNKVAFDGSCNFSQTALIENIENISAFCDWDEKRDKARVMDVESNFAKTFSGEDDTVIYLNAEQITARISHQYGNKEMRELLEDEYKLINERRRGPYSPSINNALKKAQNTLKTIILKRKKEEMYKLYEPSFPYQSGPRDYQLQALENWNNNNRIGLFAMATGTGKTITSLNCLLEQYKETGEYKALILVPTITIVEQWGNECKKFNFNNIIKVCSKSPNWRKKIDEILLQEKHFPEKESSYVIIATYASYVKPRYFQSINQLSENALLIADECHNMGSGKLLALLEKISSKQKIGLSATPERQFDEEGNRQLCSFFNCSNNSYTYEIDMKEAIKKGILCTYFYYPRLVSLNDEEMKEYMELSQKISHYYNKKTDSFKKDPILTALLLKRKRIIHKAENKLEAFKKILEDRFNKKHHLKYTLVYVPEGNDTNDYYESDYFSKKDVAESEHEDDLHLIDVYSKAVCDVDKRITVKKFVSGTSDRNEIISKFACGEIDVLTSMKCLDEGIDVPRAELAFFCASTGNKRQFVQRRGRILRQHPDKSFAYIYDLVVIPKVSPESNSYTMERNMLKKELERVRDFAETSENSADTHEALLDIMNYYKLNLYNND